MLQIMVGKCPESRPTKVTNIQDQVRNHNTPLAIKDQHLVMGLQDHKCLTSLRSTLLDFHKVRIKFPLDHLNYLKLILLVVVVTDLLAKPQASSRLLVLEAIIADPRCPSTAVKVKVNIQLQLERNYALQSHPLALKASSVFQASSSAKCLDNQTLNRRDPQVWAHMISAQPPPQNNNLRLIEWHSDRLVVHHWDNPEISWVEMGHHTTNLDLKTWHHVYHKSEWVQGWVHKEENSDQQVWVLDLLPKDLARSKACLRKVPALG